MTVNFCIFGQQFFKCLSFHYRLGLYKIYVWFLFPYLIFFTSTLNIKMVFGENVPKIGTFSVFVTIFCVKCYNEI